MDVRFSGTAAAVDYLPHPPILVSLLSGQTVVLHDHRFVWNHAQEVRLL
ncbi:hypothetical protein SynBIOSE41_01882 [Synechococcus sp. BIOS-E4-1]|nr:hypothetical protein SynBIOSE41_01882 [Synechococcus sp. BIOS-E4-1]